MKTEREKNMMVARIKSFFGKIGDDFFKESNTFDAKLAHSKNVTPWAKKDALTYKPIKEGDKWGELWDSAWVKLSGTIPQNWQNQKIVCRLNLGGECLIFDKNGVPLYGLTNTSVFASQYRKEYYFDCKVENGKLELDVEVANNGLFGDELNPYAPHQVCKIGEILHAKYGIFNEDLWRFKLEFEVAMGLLNIQRVSHDCIYGTPAFVNNSRQETLVLDILNKVIDCYLTTNDVTKSRKILAQILDKHANDSAMEVCAVGHAHIDTGWLWPVRESIRKSARTFASQISLMEKYPDFVFGASQAQHYAFVKEHYPELFEKIKAKVANGQWEIQGGMWVECDCNLVSGESLVRQFIHGKKFFKDNFNVEVDNLWLPDVFGYSAALPQIIKKSDCNYFLTQKISWSQFNKFPYHAFTWNGLGNYEVLSFFPPEDNYNAMLVPDQLNYGADNLSENAVIGEYLSLFGIGNGGGGPKEEFIERGILCKDLEGSPKVKFGRSDDFFKRLEKVQANLPKWEGELYLELHRGTLTSQAYVKKMNRLLEQMLQATEILYSTLPIKSYPYEQLDKLWKTLLINQFHDIIPGSSIKEVYDVTHVEYQAMFNELLELQKVAIEDIGSTDDSKLTLFNTLSYDYDKVVKLPANWTSVKGYPCEIIDGEVYAKVSVPKFSSLVLEKSDETNSEANKSNSLVLENDLIRYEFNANGNLISGFDKELQSETVNGAANILSLYADIPQCYDAWDIDLEYENMKIEEAKVSKINDLAKGELLQKLAIDFTISDSKISQKITLEHNSKLLKFNTQVDWHEAQKMLRVAFPITQKVAEGSCDIQYGYIKRPTHRNSSWDKAKFEIAAHKYIDLSDELSGVALLNDSKYGHKITDNILDLNLLRSPIWPDKTCDIGKHEFTYAYLPHTGNLINSDVMKEATILNRSLMAFENIEAKLNMPFEIVDNQNVTVEVVKRAESVNEKWIIRLVETSGGSGRIKLKFKSATIVQECNLIERILSPANLANDGIVELNLSAFEIKSLCY